MMNTILSIILASSIGLSNTSLNPTASTHQPSSESTPNEQTSTFNSASDLLNALAQHDASTTTISGTIRFTNINALEGDRQQRIGKLAIKKDENHHRHYAVSFKTLLIDDRQEQIDEHYLFDGRWFIERLPEEKQFNKRELVPAGETLDPMALMRDAPFWVSLGQDQDRLLESYHATLHDTNEALVDNEDYPELEFLAQQNHIKDSVQLMLTPKPGSGYEDDWEWVRIWVNPETKNPALYIKAEWTGDLQVVELFAVKNNIDIPLSVFDTTTPDARDGWRVQSTSWRDNRPNRDQSE